MHSRIFATLWLASLAAPAQEQPAQAPSSARDNATPTLDTIQVTAPPLEMSDIFRSKAPLFTEPTIFDRAWREPVSLKKIGDEGGVVPMLVGYAMKKVTQGARKIPGWKGTDQPAVARPPPLDEAQMRRALQFQAGPPPAP